MRSISAIALAALALWAAAATAAPPPGSAAGAPGPADIAAGANLFTVSCSSSYCHGLGGVGARGPSLQNRGFPADYVRTTILQGRPNTPMPSFKGTYGEAEIRQIVAYVESLSPDSAAGGSASSADASAIAAPAAPLSPQAARGEELFFDLAKPAACAACHSYRDAGGPVGPDLAALSSRSPRDLYQAILHPAANSDAQAVAVTMRDGAKLAGIKHDEKRDAIRVYDLSSTPPVMRTLPKPDVTKIEPLTGKPAYAHDLSHYSKDGILALIAFLKSGAADAPAEIKGPDLGAP